MTYSEPICECPYYCDDCDTWHRQTLIWNSDEKEAQYTLCDADGDHEYIDEEVAESIMQSEGDWTEDYRQWVIDHDGDDPLGEFMVPTRQTDSCHVKLTLTPWVGQDTHGLAFYELKTTRVLGQEYITSNWKNIPKPLLEWLEITPIIGRAVVRWAKSHDEVVKYLEDTGAKVYRSGTRTVIETDAEWEESLPESEIKALTLKSALKNA